MEYLFVKCASREYVHLQSVITEHITAEYDNTNGMVSSTIISTMRYY